MSFLKRITTRTNPTYVDDDGLVHNVEEPEEDDDPAFDMSAYDTEALAKLDEIFGNVLELR